jgi:GNAT superfamily N-acetyltransferase
VTDIRRATAADFPALVEMGRDMHAESPRYRGMSYDAAKVAELAKRLADMKDIAILLVAERAGEVIGMFVALIAERWFSQDRYITDLTVYVKPEYRGGSAFYRLVKAFEDWAEKQGVQDIAIGVSTEIHAERTVRAYQQLGYRLAGYTMVKHGH